MSLLEENLRSLAAAGGDAGAALDGAGVGVGLGEVTEVAGL